MVISCAHNNCSTALCTLILFVSFGCTTSLSRRPRLENYRVDPNLIFQLLSRRWRRHMYVWQNRSLNTLHHRSILLTNGNRFTDIIGRMMHVDWRLYFSGVAQKCRKSSIFAVLAQLELGTGEISRITKGTGGSIHNCFTCMKLERASTKGFLLA